MLYRILILCGFLLSSHSIVAQLDTSNAEELSNAVQEQVLEHSISKATWRSVILPGLGQIYNRKYWKAPIIWAGMGTSIGFAIYHNKNYKEFRDAYNIRVDDNPETQDPYEGIYTANQLITIQTTYRRWRDLSIIITVGVYAYNILDAYIDAHLFYFDISDDLSLLIEPTLLANPMAVWSGSPGLRFQFDLK
jgi:hypothetical protein